MAYRSSSGRTAWLWLLNLSIHSWATRGRRRACSVRAVGKPLSSGSRLDPLAEQIGLALEHADKVVPAAHRLILLRQGVRRAEVIGLGWRMVL